MPRAFAQKRTVIVKDTCSSFFPWNLQILLHNLYATSNCIDNAHANKYEHAKQHTHTHTRTHTYTHTCTHTHSHTYMRTHTHVHAHTHIHTHTHTHIHMQVYGTMSTFQYPLPAVRPNSLWPTYNQRYVIHYIFSVHTLTKILLHEVNLL